MFHRSPFFFSFLNGTLDVAGEVGGLLEFVAVGAASAGVSTSADMALSEPHRTSGRSVVEGGVEGAKQTASSALARSGEETGLNSRTCFSRRSSGAERHEKSEVGQSVS